MRNVAILIFDQIEVLDFTGPYEVFNVTAELNTTTAPGGPPPPFNVYTIAESLAPIRTRGQLSINPNYCLFDIMPSPNIVVVPGGAGCRALLQKPHILEWLQKLNTNPNNNVEYILSVCTGSLILAKAGIFDGNIQKVVEVTTHHDNLNDLQTILNERNIAKNVVKVNSTKRYIVIDNNSNSNDDDDDESKIKQKQQPKSKQPIIVTSGGISAGIDMCLYIIQTLCGNDILIKTLNEMEYPWTSNIDLTWKVTSQQLLK